MRKRHSVPVVFSLSMVDVMCCGLGGMILLMMLNSWNARRQALAVTKAHNTIDQTHVELVNTLQLLEEARGRLGQSERKVMQTESERKELQAKLVRLSEQYKNLDSDSANLLLDLLENQRILALLQTELRTAERKQIDTAAVADLVPTLRDEMKKLAAQIKLLESNLEEKTKVANELPTIKGELDKSTLEILLLRKQLVDAGVELKSSKDKVTNSDDEIKRLRSLLAAEGTSVSTLRTQLAASESRFAGVDLSGKRVVFLVDKSGSMTLRRDSEPDPLKWPTVTQTLEHIMKSMPKVEQYQVIVFSSRAESLFGDTDWRTFQRDTSPQEAATALAKVVPQGGTNLYSGFEAAYRLQEKGLDTIILVSDGLPSAGLNMPEGADSRTLGRQVLELVRLRHRTSAVRIHSIGFFYESPELGSFLWTLSRETGGNFVGMSKP